MKNLFKRFLKEESAQGAVEYILILVIVVAVALVFRKQILEIVGTKLDELGQGIGSVTSDPQ